MTARISCIGRRLARCSFPDSPDGAWNRSTSGGAHPAGRGLVVDPGRRYNHNTSNSGEFEMHEGDTVPTPTLYVTVAGPTKQSVATALDDLVLWFEGLIDATHSETEIAFPSSYCHIQIHAHAERYPMVRSDDLQLLERLVRYASRRAPYTTPHAEQGRVHVSFELRGDLAAV